MSNVCMPFFTDDQHNEWCPPFANSGSIFVESRSPYADAQATSLTYKDTEKFLCFIDKYVKQAVGSHNLSKWMKLNGSKMLLDRITLSVMAYTIILYDDSASVWREELEIKATSKTEEERRSARRHQNQGIIMQLESTLNIIVMDGLLPTKSTTQR